MKKVIIFTILSFSVSLIFSQNIRLTEKQWFVVEIGDTGGGNTIEIPKNRMYFPFTTLNFSHSGFIYSSNYLTKENCEKGFTAHINYDGNDLNASLNFNDITLINMVDNCTFDDVEMQNFMDLYVSFFNDFSSDTFNYFIMDVYGVDNLIIENTNGRRIWFTENPTDFTPTELTQKWYLHKTIINGIESIAPNGLQNGFANIELNIRNYYYENLENHLLDINQTFSTNSCHLTNALIDFDMANQEFYLYDLNATTESCDNSISQNFSDQYMNLFWSNLPGPFIYEINESNNLVITNVIGNKAIYGQFTLSVAENRLIDKVLLYPNPVKDFLNIGNEKIKEVKIYSEIGQLLGSFSISVIDLSSYNKGVYFIKLIFNSDYVKIKRIIKVE